MDLLSPTSSPLNSTTSSPPSPSTTSPPPSPSTTSPPPSPSTSVSPPSPSTSAPPPATTTTSSPPPSASASPPSPSTTSSPPSDSSTPPPQSPPPSPPPSPPLSPPPSSPPPSPPPSPPQSPPPPSTPSSPPPSPPTLTPPPPPSPPTSPPPSPPLSPPPPNLRPPPPSGNSPPPQSAPDTPPPPQTPSPPPPHAPPPENVVTPPTSNPPPPQSGKSPPPPHHVAPPPHSQSPPPPSNSPPGSPLSLDSPPPPSIPSSSPPIFSSSPPPISPVSPTNSSSQSPSLSPLPSVTPEKPTAKATTGTNVTVAGSSGNGGLSPGPSVAIAVVIGFLIVSLLVTAVWFLKKRKRRNEFNTIPHTLPSLPTSSHNSDSSFLRSPVPLMGSRSVNDFMYSSAEAGGMSNSRGFTYEDLVQATNSFSAKNILGEGGFGCVFKGTLPDGREIAVKQLKLGGDQGEREFRAEVDIISRIHHRHLVSLVGYCISEYQRLLVYDYVPNNTVHYHLHGKSPLPLSWATRARIAVGAARGIAYLHEDCHPRIIHRDIKSSNILLDINFEAQVADFGLAKLTLDTHTHVSTRVMGTFGYMAPEYATSGKLTDKSDVFSFGVVLLELITGRKPVDDSQPLGDESLVEWARPLLSQALDSESFEELVDARLEKNYVPSEIFRMIEAAAACVRHSAVKRPRMSQVVRALDSLDEMSDLANGVKPGQSGVFDSAQHSAQIRMFQRMAFGSQELSTENFDRDRSRRSQSSWNGRDDDDDLSSSAPFNRSRLF